MKKIFVLGVIMTLFVGAASAQRISDPIHRQRVENSFNTGQLTRPEVRRLHNDRVRYKDERRRAFRDGRLNPMEKRRLQHMRHHDRRDLYRFRHNGRRRAI